jgi:putative flavoprotein involved in K+ transport
VKQVTTVIIGAGQAGLAMSRHLARRSIDHVVLERGEVANSWRKERWDSLRLLTPNWQSRLPGYTYEGDDPHGYMTMPEVVGYLEQFARRSAAPVESHTKVTCVSPTERGYRVATDRGAWQCQSLVIASGACNVASVPKLAADVPAGINSTTPMQYRNPGQLEDGGVLVVGASATGVQLAQEIQASGRQVTIAVGEHVRVPRMYRGRDIKWWMDASGVLDSRFDETDDISRARHVPSLQLVGSPEHATLDLNCLRASGVEIVGRFAGLRDGTAQFSGSLGNQCALADLKMNRLLETIDAWSAQHGMDVEIDAPHRFAPTDIGKSPRLGIDLAASGIKTIVWATGYRPDYSWLQVPVFDRKGRLRHDGGIVDAPGMYVMGLPFLRRRKSSLIDGADADAGDLADHLCSGFLRAAA